MSCCIDLHSFCITDMICTFVCQEIEVVMFLGSFQLCLFVNYVNQTTKSNLSKVIIKLKFGERDFQNDRQFFYHHGNYFLR